MRHAGHAGKEALLLRVLAGGEGQRTHGPAVETAQKPDEAAPSRGVARQFQSRFHALGAGLREEAHDRLLHGRQNIETLRQLDLALVPVVRRNVQELVRGILDGLNHRRVAMAGAAHRDAGGEIQKAVAVHIPDFRTLAVRHDEGIVARIGRRDDERIAREQLSSLGARQIGFDVRLFHIPVQLPR